jgi:hypothetical protein
MNMNNTNEMCPIVKRCPSFDENYELQPRTLFPQDTPADVDYNDDGNYTCRHGIEMSRRDSTICDSCFWETQEESTHSINPLKRQTTFCTEDGINIIRPFDVARQVSFDLQKKRQVSMPPSYDVESQIHHPLFPPLFPYDVERQVLRPYDVERQVGIGQEQEGQDEEQGQGQGQGTTTLTDIIIQQQQQQEQQDDLAEERYNFDLYHRDITYRGGANLYYDRESSWGGAMKFETICNRIAKYEWDSVV